MLSANINVHARHLFDDHVITADGARPFSTGKRLVRSTEQRQVRNVPIRPRMIVWRPFVLLSWADNDRRNPVVTSDVGFKNGSPITTRVHAMVMLADATVP